MTPLLIGFVIGIVAFHGCRALTQVVFTRLRDWTTGLPMDRRLQRELVSALATMMIALTIIIALVFIPITATPEYTAHARGGWSWLFYNTKFLLGLLGIVVGAGCASWINSAREPAAANVATRGKATAGFVFLSLLVGVEHDTGILHRLTKISTGALSIELEPAGKTKDGASSPFQGISSAPASAASRRIELALLFLNQLPRNIEQDRRIATRLGQSDGIRDEIPPATSNFIANHIIPLAERLAFIHQFRRDTRPLFFTDDGVLLKEFAGNLRTLVLAELWARDGWQTSDHRRTLIRLVTESLKHVWHHVTKSMALYCQFDSAAAARSPADEENCRKLLRQRLSTPTVVEAEVDGIDVTVSPDIVIAAAAIMHAMGEAEAGALVLDRWIAVADRSLEKRTGRITTPGYRLRLGTIRAQNLLGVMLAATDNPVHLQLAPSLNFHGPRLS